jgi:hypothetical protein
MSSLEHLPVGHEDREDKEDLVEDMETNEEEDVQKEEVEEEVEEKGQISDHKRKEPEDSKDLLNQTPDSTRKRRSTPRKAMRELLPSYEESGDIKHPIVKQHIHFLTPKWIVEKFASIYKNQGKGKNKYWKVNNFHRPAIHPISKPSESLRSSHYVWLLFVA